MKSFKSLVSLVESAKISKGNVSTQAKVAGLYTTKANMTTAEWMHTSGASDRSAAGLNNIKILRKQDVMDSTIEDIGTE